MIENNKMYDAILIDDDSLIRLMWNNSAKDHDKSIGVFQGSKQFFENMHQIHRDSIIYIDSNLGDGIRGEIVAQEIYENGFKKIFLTTGYEAASFERLPWLLGIIGKLPPWEMLP